MEFLEQEYLEYQQQCRSGLADAVTLLKRKNELILSLPTGLTRDLLRWRGIDIGHLFMCLGSLDSKGCEYDENGELIFD